MPVIVELKEVSKSYGNSPVLDGVSLTIDEGSITGIIGKSGCGKTTLLSVMVGFLRPNRGRVYYRGKDLFKSGKAVEGRFGFSSQETSFYDKLTVEENLSYFGKMYGLKRKIVNDRAEALIRLFELESAADTTGGELSSGMQKRLDIACALIHDPEVLFLDEPTANLDPLLRKDIIKLIKKIKGFGTTVVITSHILGEIDYLCDKIAILDNKRIVVVDSPKNLVSSYSGEKVIKLRLGSKDYKKVTSFLNTAAGLIRQVYTEEDFIVIVCEEPEEVVKEILKYAEKNKDSIDSLKLEGVSIGSLFEAILKKRKG